MYATLCAICIHVHHTRTPDSSLGDAGVNCSCIYSQVHKTDYWNRLIIFIFLLLLLLFDIKILNAFINVIKSTNKMIYSMHHTSSIYNLLAYLSRANSFARQSWIKLKNFITKMSLVAFEWAHITTYFFGIVCNANWKKRFNSWNLAKHFNQRTVFVVFHKRKPTFVSNNKMKRSVAERHCTKIAISKCYNLYN